MAIVRTPTGNVRTVLSGTTMITVGASGSQVMQWSTTNRAPGPPSRAAVTMPPSTQPGSVPQIPSPAFTTLDKLIFDLDAAYDALPDKTPWITYAANIDGRWQLCANCMPDAAPKKLYRQYNYNRSLIGLPRVDIPIDDNETCDEFDIGAALIRINHTGVTEAVVGSSPGTQDFWAIAQIGMVASNPMVFITSADRGVFFTSGPIFDWVAEVAQFYGGFAPAPSSLVFQLPKCIFTATGAPGLRAAYDFEVINLP